MQSRITVILHPNTARVDITLNDRMFNKEKYSFSREREPVGPELQLLNILEECTVGVESAKTSKNKLSLEIFEGMYHSEYIPAVILAIKKWASDPEYSPVVYCEDRRWKKEPKYVGEDFIEYEIGGEKYSPGEVNLGLPYIPWEY